LCNESPSCRIDWRPSRLLCVALAGLGALAAIAVAGSDAPLAWKAAAAVLALLRGLQLARREWNQPPCALSFGLEGGDAMIHQPGGEESMRDVRLALRGVLVELRWRDPRGRARSLRWAADTLDPAGRRALRLRFGGAPA
jgi:toxin CptA